MPNIRSTAQASCKVIENHLCLALLTLFCAAVPAFGQTAVCPAVAHALTPADQAYSDGSYAQAEQLYVQALAGNPKDIAAGAALVRTLLHEDKVSEAGERVQALLAVDPHSAAALTAKAQLEFRQGEPWLALQSLDAAEAADPCYALAHLIRSRVFRIDSMYGSERAELDRAYAIDPKDPDILNAWNSVVRPAQEVEGIHDSLDSMKDLDAATRQKAATSMNSMLPLLSEQSQTCKVEPAAGSAALPLLPSKEDGKHIDGFRIEVQLPKSTAKLIVDTAASGLYISRALADANELKQGDGDPPRTARVDDVRIGPLEFHDCLVGVSDTTFPGKGDGFIGTDVFASYLVRIDSRDEKMTLSRLPSIAGILPGDRPRLPELTGFTPVYHRRQYLLVPVTLNNRSRQLFVLDTGMQLSTMTPETAHAVSNMKVNFTNTMQTASGPPAQVYRDSFDFQFGNMALNHRNRIVEFDPAAIDHNAGFDVGGLLGFDMLGAMMLELDYRDGLVRFEIPGAESAPVSSKELAASGAPSPAGVAPVAQLADNTCARENVDRPINTTVEATVQFTVDSAHLKPGKEFWVKTLSPYTLPGCLLQQGAIVYGTVIAASSRKNSGTPELAVAFDRGDCRGHSKQPMVFRLIGIVAPPTQSAHLHEMLPTEVAGGARQISNTVASTDGYDAKEIQALAPAIVHPGVVVGMPGVTLEPDGGPQCSARITTTGRSVELGGGVELILEPYGKGASPQP